MSATVKIQSIDARQENGVVFAIFACRVMTGEVHAGESLTVPLSAMLDVMLTVHSVEAVDLPLMNIMVVCDDMQDVDIFRSVIPMGFELTVAATDSAG